MFDAKTTIVRQGEPGGDLFILAKGSVAIVREDPELGIEHVVKELRAPEVFGEMSLLTNTPRAATVRTLEETACVVLAAASYESLLDKLPVVAVEISRYLARRLEGQMSIMGFRFVGPEELVHDPELQATFSPEKLRKHQAIPLRLEGSTLTVAMTRPHSLAAVKALRQEVPGLGLHPVACSVEDFDAFMQRHFPASMGSAWQEASACCVFRDQTGCALPEPLAALLAQAASRGGRVLVEVTGEQVALYASTPRLEPLGMALEPGMASALVDQLSHRLDGSDDLASLPVLAGERRCEVTLSRLRTRGGERYSLSLRDPQREMPSAASLWPTEALRATVEQAVTGGTGAVLVSGPTHSGRSTTLYALLALLRREEGGHAANLIALEREPLLTLDGVAQVRLRGDLGGHCQADDLLRVLRVALAQHPHGLLVDEPRPEDLDKVLEAAQDGLTVLTTIKGEDPLSALVSLRERADSALAHVDNLRLLIGQHLLRRLCMECRVEYSPSAAVLSQLELSGLGTRTDRYYRGAGCARCRGTGQLGRVPVFELVQPNALLVDMLRSGRSAEALRKAAAGNGLLFSFKSFARLLVLYGQILPTEALRLYGGVSSV